MNRLLVLPLIGSLALCAGCAARPAPGPSIQTASYASQPDLAVAGWRVPFECLELAERIETSQSRLYDSLSGTFSADRGTDERRLRSLEARADELGCVVPGTPHAY